MHVGNRDSQIIHSAASVVLAKILNRRLTCRLHHMYRICNILQDGTPFHLNNSRDPSCIQPWLIKSVDTAEDLPELWCRTECRSLICLECCHAGGNIADKESYYLQLQPVTAAKWNARIVKSIV